MHFTQVGQLPGATYIAVLFFILLFNDDDFLFNLMETMEEKI